jgi:gas vesicle protein
VFNRNSGKKFALGALFAGVVGFLVGILSAPKSGKETREDLKESTRIAISQAEKDLKSIHTDLQGLIISATSSIKTSSKQVKKDFQKAIERAKKSQTKVKAVLSSVHEGTSDDPELSAALDEAKAAKTHLKRFFDNK